MQISQKKDMEEKNLSQMHKLNSINANWKCMESNAIDLQSFFGVSLRLFDVDAISAIRIRKEYEINEFQQLICLCVCTRSTGCDQLERIRYEIN